MTSEPIAGDLHLDGDEDWQAGAGIDLCSVTLHERGHALGLGHSSQPGAVMYPYYRQASALTGDNIAGIQSLYGMPVHAVQQPALSGPALQPGEPVAPLVPSAPTAPTTPAAPGTPAAAKDTTAPTVKLNGATMVTTSAASITFTGTATDNVGVVAVKWTGAAGAAGTANGTANWTVSVPLTIGTNAIVVRAFDAAGNSAWRSITVVRR